MVEAVSHNYPRELSPTEGDKIASSYDISSNHSDQENYQQESSPEPVSEALSPREGKDETDRELESEMVVHSSLGEENQPPIGTILEEKTPSPPPPKEIKKVEPPKEVKQVGNLGKWVKTGEFSQRSQESQG